jgi:acyl carrier protein
MTQVDIATVDAVCEVVGDVFGVPRAELSGLTTREQVPEWDSLGHLNLMLALEDEFDTSFSVEEMATLDSVAAIAARVRG